MTKQADQTLLTVKEVAWQLQMSEKTVRRRIDDGQLPIIRDGRLVRIHPCDLERYVASCRSL